MHEQTVTSEAQGSAKQVEADARQQARAAVTDMQKQPAEKSVASAELKAKLALERRGREAAEAKEKRHRAQLERRNEVPAEKAMAEDLVEELRHRASALEGDVLAQMTVVMAKDVAIVDLQRELQQLEQAMAYERTSCTEARAMVDELRQLAKRKEKK